MATYHADICEAGEGTFAATLREPAISVTSRDPEHDLCHAIVKQCLTDGPIQFWRGTTPSLNDRSVHRAASYRIEMGDEFPYRLVRRRAAPAVFAEDRGAGVAQNRETPLAGTSGHPTLPPVPESPAPFARWRYDRPKRPEGLSLGGSSRSARGR
jgi:hypothetical protein